MTSTNLHLLFRVWVAAVVAAALCSCASHKDGLETFGDGGWTIPSPGNPGGNASLKVNFTPESAVADCRWSAGGLRKYRSGETRPDLVTLTVNVKCSGPSDTFFLPEPNPETIPLTGGKLTTVIADFGSIVTQPQDQPVNPAGTAVFQVRVHLPQPTGTKEAYQWYRRTAYNANFVKIAGETRSELQVTNATKYDEGLYKVRVSWNRAHLDSRNARLTVRGAP